MPKTGRDGFLWERPHETVDEGEHPVDQVTQVSDGKITDMKERYRSGVLKYKQMGYWEPDYETQGY